MTQKPDTLVVRPLVTFALFAYNQESCIREAIEGAFSQTYEPLEIILSDDCSVDGTFKIMQEMGEKYDGNHKVVVRKSEKNRGLTGHINDVSAISHGDIIVMAAGDDISLSHRTTELTAEFIKYPGTMAVFSSYIIIPKNNRALRYNINRGVISLLELTINGGGVQIGATYAYGRQCFYWPEPIPGWVYSEDRVLPLRAALMGTVRYVDLELIKYRVSDKIEGKAKNSRIHGYNHPNHLFLMESHISAAQRERLISPVKANIIYLTIAVMRVVLKLRNKGGIYRHFAKFLFFPLKIVRKANVIFLQVTEWKASKIK